jgi:hypothetical protein
MTPLSLTSFVFGVALVFISESGRQRGVHVAVVFHSARILGEGLLFVQARFLKVFWKDVQHMLTPLSFFRPENGGSRFLPNCTASHATRQESMFPHIFLRG